MVPLLLPTRQTLLYGGRVKNYVDIIAVAVTHIQYREEQQKLYL
jgi:hypothetical protein